MSGLKITALICTKDEEQNLPYVLPKIPEWVDELLVVDGHSSDRTVEVVKRLCPNAKVVYQPNKGKGDALRYGIKKAQGDIIVTLDADGTSDPTEMEEFIVPLLNGYDYAKGSRFASGMPRRKPWYRIAGNWVIVLLFDALFAKRYTDLCCGYNAFWKKAIKTVDLNSADGFADEPLINCRVRKAGLRMVEVGCIDRGRIGGGTKAPAWRQGFKAVKTIVRERFCG